MSYTTEETSAHSGAPIELYLFQRGAEVWRWTSSDISVSYLGQTYTPHPISRTEIILEGRVGADDLQITVPRNNPVAEKFMVIVPASTIDVTVYRAHRSDLTDAVIPWKGRVRSVRWSGSEAVLLCDLITNVLTQQGPRKLAQRLCTHMLYDHRCKVVEDSFKVVGSIGSISGNVLSVAAAATKDDGFFVPGYARVGTDDYRMIVAHSADQITLFAPYEGVSPGDPIDLFAGCDLSKTTCFVRFNNVPNHGGLSYLPIKNPFDVGVEG